MRCVKVWLKVMTSRLYEGRLLKKIARQAVECGKGGWIKNMAKCMGDFAFLLMHMVNVHCVDYWSKFNFTFALPRKNAVSVAAALNSYLFPTLEFHEFYTLTIGENL